MVLQVCPSCSNVLVPRVERGTGNNVLVLFETDEEMSRYYYCHYCGWGLEGDSPLNRWLPAARR